jgi:hypothetical protein
MTPADQARFNRPTHMALAYTALPHTALAHTDLAYTAPPQLHVGGGGP